MIEATLRRLSGRWHRMVAEPNLLCLYMVKTGVGELTYGHITEAFRPGRSYLFPAHRPDSTGRVHPPHAYMDVYCAYFRATVLGSAGLYGYLRCPNVVDPDDPARAMAGFRRLCELDAERGPAAVLESAGVILQLLAPFVAASDPERRRAHHEVLVRFQPVLAHVDAHLADALPVPTLAGLAAMSVPHFHRAFRQTFGVTPHRFIVLRRIERAQALLLDRDATLESIAARTGFTDAFHLSRTFKRITGVAPSAYRRSGMHAASGDVM